MPFPQAFVEKTFTDSHKIVKVFSLKLFLLYYDISKHTLCDLKTIIPPGPLKGVSQLVAVKPTLHEQVLRLLQTCTKGISIHDWVLWLIH